MKHDRIGVGGQVVSVSPAIVAESVSGGGRAEVERLIVTHRGGPTEALLVVDAESPPGEDAPRYTFSIDPDIASRSSGRSLTWFVDVCTEIS